MNKYKLLIYLLSVILISILVTISLYLSKFHETKISNDPSNWAEFAGYLEGILNPILGILNLIILTYLTIKIVEIDDNRNNWTLQELARPYGNLHFDSNFDSLEIKITNCGLGPLIIEKISVEKDNLRFDNFYNLLKNFIDKSNVNPKIYSLHTGETKGAISKDQSLTLLKIEHNVSEDKIDDFKFFLNETKKFLNKTKIEITNEDMYGRIMQKIEENINFP